MMHSRRAFAALAASFVIACLLANGLGAQSMHKPGEEMAPGVGWAARFSLRRASLTNCRTMVCLGRCGGNVVVFVRDVLTGRAPISPVALRVSRDSIPHWNLGQAQDGDSLLALAAGSGEGPFTVEVAAEGYAPWYLDGVWVEEGECGQVLSKPLKVWLLRVEWVDPELNYLR